ncbi:GNAT family N-acetyltransferase [Tsuneonella amylolytica]|uniref:GNAT family N-acetyltransferase n=1 Tax=Tsuneonella amylolytica TaxID=2338327 RepID=UPI000EA8B438|nr:GNAT family N-acetyltransferase [Tsuneonella amylolytica]
MFHVTERLLLRPAWPEDWAEVLAVVGEEAIVRNLAKVPWPYTGEDARWWTRQPQYQGLPNFIVVESASGRVVGSCGLAPSEGDSEIGYWIARDAWGRGYATEAGRGVLEVARMLGIERVTAGHMTDNPASGRVLRKLGFRPVGSARRYSLARGHKVDSVEYVFDMSEDVSIPRAA